jgi:hypothetical protein
MIKNSANGRPVLALDSYGVSATSPQLIFGYRGTFDTNLFRKAANALRTSGSFEVMGTLSGSTFYGSGLGDCSNPTTSKIIYNLSTGKFSCATDQTGGVGSGLAYSAAEGIFVNQGGDTMTGALTIQNGNTPTISATPMLNVRGSISGATLRAGNMTVSGAVVYSSGNTLKQTAKGASGQILVAQGTDAPAWKNPTGAMVWYIDGTAIVQSRQGAIVTMPFAMTPTSVNLRATGAPTGTGVLIDIRRDNVSIFQRKPEILKGYTYGGTGATFSIATLTGGSVISVDIVRIGSTFAGSGITIQLNGIRKY